MAPKATESPPPPLTPEDFSNVTSLFSVSTQSGVLKEAWAHNKKAVFALTGFLVVSFFVARWRILGLWSFLAVCGIVLYSSYRCEVNKIRRAQTWLKFSSCLRQMGDSYQHDPAWLNAIISEIWPYFSKHLARQLKQQIPAIINASLSSEEAKEAEQEQKKGRSASAKSKKKSGWRVACDEFDLGHTPMQILDIHDFASVAQRFTLDLDFDLRLTGRIVMSIWMGNHCLGGVAIEKIHMKSKARIILSHFVPHPPYFAVLRFCFVGEPFFDLNLKALGVSDFFSDTIERTVVKEVLPMFVYPRNLLIKLLPDELIKKLCGVKDPAHMEDMEPEGRLKVKLCRGIKLPKSDFLGQSDPYAVLHVGDPRPGKVRKSHTKWKTLNPVWEQEFSFHIVDIAVQNLFIEVWDRDTLDADDLLGTTSISLNFLKAQGKSKKKYDLTLKESPGPRGAVELQLEWEPYRNQFDTSEPKKVEKKDERIFGELTLQIHSAKDVPKADMNGKCDPFVEVTLVQCNASTLSKQRIHDDQLKDVPEELKWKTEVCKKTLNPEWKNTRNSFHCDDARYCVLLLELLDKDMMGSEKLGWVQIPVIAALPPEKYAWPTWLQQKVSLADRTQALMPNFVKKTESNQWELTLNEMGKGKKFDLTDTRLYVSLDFRSGT